MKRIISVLLLCLMVFSLLACENNDLKTTMVPEMTVTEEPFKYHLPDWLTWGMKEGEVRQHLTEHEPILEYGDLIYVYEGIYGEGCYVREFYGFTKENSLIHMSYTFEYSGYEPNPYAEMYIEFKEELTKIYGEPTGEKEEWKNERYKDDEYMKYKAIEEGDYTSMVAWDLEDYICYIELNEGIEINYEAKK